MRLVFDAEADGLLDEATTVWCVSAKDIAIEGPVKPYGDDKIVPGINPLDDFNLALRASEELIGQNIIQYDLPLFEKILGWIPTDDTKITDTLVLSRLFNPDRPRPTGYTGKGGPHSIEAYGYRFGKPKPDHEDWTQFSEEMLYRNMEDVGITELQYNYLMTEKGDWDWDESIRIEHEIARIIAKQERNGVLFDEQRAREYVSYLTSKIEAIDEEVIPKLPKTLVRTHPGPINRPFLATGGYTKKVASYIKEAYNTENTTLVGGPFSRIKFENFNIGSVQQIKEYLLKNGWKPELWNYSKTTGERTSPKLEGEFEGIDGDIPKRVKERITWRHRRSQIQGWLGNLRPDGRLSAGANPCGTNTGRMKHRTVVNVPKVNIDKKTGELIWDTDLQKDLFGTQMRSLFTVPKGYKMVGFDASGIQLRMLAHYMDDFNFTEQILSGDIHEYNRTNAGLSNRDAAKTFIYALVFGAGDAKIGSIVGGSSEDGKRLKDKFFTALPKLKQLIDRVKRASGKGFVKGLDGRKIWMRRGDDGRIQRSRALNALLQCAEAVVMKQSSIFLDKWVDEHNLDALKVIDMHDEAQWQVADKDVELFKELAVKSIVQAGEYFNLNIPLAAEAKVGMNWAETH